MLLRRPLAAFLAALALLAPQGATAQMTDLSEAISVQVLQGWRRADGVHVAGLAVDLSPGWKTYWRSAGSAGIPPQMDWRGSKGARSVTPSWPTPIVFGDPGALSIGYDADFVLPLLIATDGGAPVRLRGELAIGVCRDICVPARLSVAADLAPGAAPDPVIEAALRDRPRRVAASARCDLRPTPDGLALTGTLDLPPQGGPETVVFEIPDPDLWMTDAVTRREGGRITAEAEVLAMQGSISGLDRSRIRITVIGRSGAVEIAGCTG